MDIKILLDENVPVLLKYEIKNFDTFTVRDMNWLGKKNGKLLTDLQNENFNFFVTADKNLRYQQNLEKYKVTVFLLDSKNNNFDTLKSFIHKVEKLIELNNFEVETVNIISIDG